MTLKYNSVGLRIIINHSKVLQAWFQSSLGKFRLAYSCNQTTIVLSRKGSVFIGNNMISSANWYF